MTQIAPRFVVTKGRSAQWFNWKPLAAREDTIRRVNNRVHGTAHQAMAHELAGDEFARLIWPTLIV
jgi:hypothetical protein